MKGKFNPQGTPLVGNQDARDWNHVNEDGVLVPGPPPMAIPPRDPTVPLNGAWRSSEEPTLLEQEEWKRENLRKELGVEPPDIPPLFPVQLMSKHHAQEPEPASPDNVSPGPYAHLPDHPSVGPGKMFTQTQKAKILAENQASNGGVLTDDVTGEELQRPRKHVKGVTPPEDEAHVDHLRPRSKEGSNSYGNAMVRSRKNNLAKGDRPE